MLKKFAGLYVLFWVLADQGIKYWVLQRIAAGETIAVLPGFDLRLGFNPGIAFSLYRDVSLFAKGLMYSFIGALIIWVAMEAGKAIERGNQISILAWLTVLAGALGNYIDRLSRGAVVDYIDLYYSTWHWYTFNLADIAICMGAALLVFELLQEQRKHAAVAISTPVTAQPTPEPKRIALVEELVD